MRRHGVEAWSRSSGAGLMTTVTSRQFGLFDRPRSFEERFLAYHARHPEVYAELVRRAREARAAGRRRVGIRMLWGRTRATLPP